MRYGMPSLAGVPELWELPECIFGRAGQYESILPLLQLLHRDGYQPPANAKEATD
jgi:hypothetical protein